jgi:hypothetical protein
MSSRREGGGGCALIIAVIVVIALVVAAVVSVAALIDPFSWLPPIGKIFGDCTDNPNIPGDDCDIATRYPGFWWHVVVNFLYSLAALGLVVALVAVVPDYRAARTDRFESDTAVERYRQARQNLALVAVLLGGLAAIPVIAALV